MPEVEFEDFDSWKTSKTGKPMSLNEFLVSLLKGITDIDEVDSISIKRKNRRLRALQAILMPYIDSHPDYEEKMKEAMERRKTIADGEEEPYITKEEAVETYQDLWLGNLSRILKKNKFYGEDLGVG